jgi:hypothetical protein
MAAISANPTTISPTLVYSARDYDTILAAAIQYLQKTYPQRWKDFSASNSGVPLIEVGAWMDANLSWNLDTQVSETFLATAQLKNSVLTLAGNVGYVPIGRTAAIVLVNATLITAPNTVGVTIPAGTQVKSLQGQIFEVYEDTMIAPGQLTPTVAVASQNNTSPQGLLVNFVAGATTVTFELGATAGSFSLAVEAGMWIQSTGQYQQWYQIASLDTNKTTITLNTPWNSIFTGAFVIKTAGSDAASSQTIVSATPYGTYPATATATLNSTTVTFSAALPQSVIAGQWFRFNGLTSCCGSGWFQIAGVSLDYTTITLTTPFGPTTPNGFDDLNVGFNIQNESMILINGSSRTDRFASNVNATTQSFSLLGTPVIPSTVKVYDQDGQTDTNGNPLPWISVPNLNQAVLGSANYRSYQLVEVSEDSYEIRFGNGLLGKIPTGVVTVNYRVGGGPNGNVPPNSFNVLVSGTRGNNTVSVQVSNPTTYGQGGAYGEDINSLKANIPTYYATNSRAVTAKDYQTLVLQNYPQWPNAIGSIAQATINQALNAYQYGGNIIYINTWTTTQWSPPSATISGTLYPVLTPPNAALIGNVQTFLDQYAMVTDVPTVLQGEVDEAVVGADLQITSTTNAVNTGVAAEQALIALFNSQSVVDGNPLLLSDVYGVLETIPGVVSVRMRSLYLDYLDPLQPGDIDITPVSLQTIGDLYPRSLNSIVTPADLQFRTWSVNIGVSIYISAILYPNTQLAEEEIQKDLQTYFFNKRPGEGVSIAGVTDVIMATLAGSVQIATPVRVASGVNIDITNGQALDVLNVDGINLKNGDRILLFAQGNAAQNGVYVVGGLTGPNVPWNLTPASDLDSYNELTPGTLISVTGGITYIGQQFFYNTHNLNYTTFAAGAKTFTVGNLLSAEASLIAITTLNSVRFSAPIGNTPTSFNGLPATMYYLGSLTINGSSPT